MTESSLSPFLLRALLPALFLMSGLSGCGGGGSRRSDLSVSGRGLSGLRLSFSQQSASIANGQGNRYTLTAKNDSSQTKDYSFVQDSQGLTPAALTIENQAKREIYNFPDFDNSVALKVTLRPGQSVSRTIAVPASVLAAGSYQATAYFFNDFADAPSDKLAPLELVVR